MIYECHITVDVQHAAVATAIAEGQHWKTSEIARDPVLGNKNFFYLTTHDADFPTMWERMVEASDTLQLRGVEVLRSKIELIIYDSRATKG